MSNRCCRDGRGLKTVALLTVSAKGHLLGRERTPRHHVRVASRLFTGVCLLLLTVDKADATPLHRRQPAQSSLGTCSRPQSGWRRQHTSALAPPEATASLLKAGAPGPGGHPHLGRATCGNKPSSPQSEPSSLPGQVLASWPLEPLPCSPTSSGFSGSFWGSSWEAAVTFELVAASHLTSFER